MIHQQKVRIKKKQLNFTICNAIFITIIVLICLCDALDTSQNENHHYLYGILLFYCPLYLTCIVFVIALCKISNSIKAIAIWRLHQRLICIHFFNVITFTIFATIFLSFKTLQINCDPNGSLEEQLKFYQYGTINRIIELARNMFQLYLDSFILYVILLFTRDQGKSDEQMRYDTILKREVPNMVFIRNQQILDKFLK